MPWATLVIVEADTSVRSVGVRRIMPNTSPTVPMARSRRSAVGTCRPSWLRLARDVSVRTSHVGAGDDEEADPVGDDHAAEAEQLDDDAAERRSDEARHALARGVRRVGGDQLVGTDEPGQERDLGRVVDPRQDGLDGGDEERRPDPVRVSRPGAGAA